MGEKQGRAAAVRAGLNQQTWPHLGDGFLDRPQVEDVLPNWISQPRHPPKGVRFGGQLRKKSLIGGLPFGRLHLSKGGGLIRSSPSPIRQRPAKLPYRSPQ